MSLRALALELYALEQEVEHLTNELDQVPPSRKHQLDLKRLQSIAKRDRLRAVLRAKKG